MAELQQMIPGLPEELALECLNRTHCLALRAASRVCRAWHKLLGSPEFYQLRKQNGHTQLAACLIQAVIGPRSVHTSSSPPAFGITLFDPVSQSWVRVEQVPGYANGLPLYCQVASYEGKLVIMGGWDPITYDPVSHVLIYDFMTWQWRKGKDMPAKRSLFTVGAIQGWVLVAGGHDPHKNATKLAWAYNVLKDEWHELPQMSEERDEAQGVVIGPEFWVISGYETKAQGRFKSNADVYNIETGQWRRAENVWIPNKNPRSYVGVWGSGELNKWVNSELPSQLGTCAVDLGGQVLEYNCEIPGFLLIDKRKHSNVNSDDDGIHKLDVPNEFAGFVQSGCAVEI